MFDRFGLMEPYKPCDLILQVNGNSLWLGDYRAAMDVVNLKVMDIKTLISVISNIDFKYTDIEHKIIHIKDKQDQQIQPHFEQTFDWIDQGLQNGSVLVHCAMGISRSASIVIAYVIKKFNFTYAKAYNIVRKGRPIICPNLGFSKQLKEYEKITLVGREFKAISQTWIQCPDQRYSTKSRNNQQLANSKHLRQSYAINPSAHSSNYQLELRHSSLDKGKAQHRHFPTLQMNSPLKLIHPFEARQLKLRMRTRILNY